MHQTVFQKPKNDCFKSREPSPTKSFWTLNVETFAQVSFLVLALGMLVLLHETDEFKTLSITFIAIVLEAFPFMLIGTLIGGMIEVFIPRERIASIFPKQRWLTVLTAAALGIILPVCECAIVPVVRRLLRKGVPLSAAIAYLLAGPIVNPLVAASTAVAYSFSWQVAAIRVAIGYIIAAGVGLLMDLFFTIDQAILPDSNPQWGCNSPHHHNDTTQSLPAKLHFATQHAAEDFFDIGRFLIVGAFIAALLQTLIARQAFASAVGVSALSIFFMMALAFVLNLCSEADAFVAASFRSTAIPFSAQMAFMVLGPMLDIKLILMYLSVFRKRAIVVLSLTTSIIVFLTMLAVEYTSL